MRRRPGEQVPPPGRIDQNYGAMHGNEGTHASQR